MAGEPVNGISGLPGSADAAGYVAVDFLSMIQ